MVWPLKYLDVWLQRDASLRLTFPLSVCHSVIIVSLEGIYFRHSIPLYKYILVYNEVSCQIYGMWMVQRLNHGPSLSLLEDLNSDGSVLTDCWVLGLLPLIIRLI